MNAPLAACAALILLLGLPAQAAMYKWVDKDGGVVYSEMPPPDAGSATMIAPPPPPPDTRAGDDSAPGQAGTNKPTGINEQSEQARLKFEALRRKNCEIAKENLHTYRTAARLRTTDGTVVELDAATRAARIAQAEKDIATYCTEENP